MVGPNAAPSTVKFLCSYGGKILPRYPDGKLRYHGGHTRVLAVHRSVSFAGNERDPEYRKVVPYWIKQSIAYAYDGSILGYLNCCQGKSIQDYCGSFLCYVMPWSCPPSNFTKEMLNR